MVDGVWIESCAETKVLPATSMPRAIGKLSTACTSREEWGLNDHVGGEVRVERIVGRAC